jgi:hypothetical protein
MDNLRSLDGSADDDAREEDIKNVAGSIYTAGKDTVCASMFTSVFI